MKKAILIAMIAVVFPAGALAQEPGPQVEILQMPARLPEMSGASALPRLNLPEPPSSYPQNPGIIKPVIGRQLEGLADGANAQYAWVLDRIYEGRELTGRVSALVGETQPQREGEQFGAMGIAFGESPITAHSIAGELASTIRFAMGYMRAISNLGPTGLSLVFIFLGLGWVALVNVADLGVRSIAWLLRTIGAMIIKVFGFVLGITGWVLNFILSILRMLLGR